MSLENKKPGIYKIEMYNGESISVLAMLSYVN